MSENENVNDGVNDGTGHGDGSPWGWEPVPHGGEYDSDATAFVKLPPEMLGATGTGEPLEAPGHGFVPPPMIVPLGSAGTDPAATGTWTLPVRWPEAAGSAPAAPAARTQAPAAPVLGPIPAVIPMPASAMAALHGDAEPGADAEGNRRGNGNGHADTDRGAGPDHGYEYGHAPDQGHESGSTAEWRFPEAAQPAEDPYGDQNGGPYGDQSGHHDLSGLYDPHDPHGQHDPNGQHGQHDPHDPHGQSGQTGQWAIPVVDGELPEESGEFRRGAAAADWSQAPATLPGGAAAPWATHPGLGLSDAEQHHAEQHHGEQYRDERRQDERHHAEQRQDEPVAGASRFDAFGALDPEQTMSAGVLPPDPGAGPEQRVHGEADAGLARLPRGPRVLGGPGVGTPLPEALEHEEGQVAPAPDIDAAHGAAGAPVTAERPHPAAEPEHVEERGAQPPGEHVDGAEEAFGSGGAGGAPGAGEGEHRETAAAPEADGPGEVPDAGTTYDEGAAAPVQDAAPVHEEHPLASYVLRVNGADRPVTGAWIGESLLYVLRERLGLAGAKDGCSQGECGACAVQVDGRLVASCLVPAATAASSEVRTVEGLAADGEPSDVQRALCRSGAVQCGFCVPGMAMTIHDLLEGNHAPSELQTRQALCGNLCRCSGYRGVIDAVGEVVAERAAAAESGAPGGAGAEPRIPHQAAPGEGGIHPDRGHDHGPDHGSATHGSAHGSTHQQQHQQRHGGMA
ncbi:2Fe-2S iron-sulfur cluster-binding protein [Streptomyces sp. G-G2]|uniref:2Fe-2S iron-sulfur cluster-binding protein n=1 Tax=Streptomyces sp. G-G2 TaxID=3046201 RepID=UPI0024B9ED1D|nr:2Fe-2S iron-sulfur cluster-binding protein [Streptomyces sp. G-G2]MDJ0379576.1 2Fe-2S iron-sulfur cluster-binding protein [Streptomyces sp. G-G2]